MQGQGALFTNNAADAVAAGWEHHVRPQQHLRRQHTVDLGVSNSFELENTHTHTRSGSVGKGKSATCQLTVLHSNTGWRLGDTMRRPGKSPITPMFVYEPGRHRCPATSAARRREVHLRGWNWSSAVGCRSTCWIWRGKRNMRVRRAKTFMVPLRLRTIVWV